MIAMKKRIPALILAAFMLSLAPTGCNKDNSAGSSPDSTQSSAQTSGEEASSAPDTQKHIIFSANSMKFYTPANAIIQMTGTSTFHLLDIKNLENTQPIVVSPDLKGLVQDGVMLYGTQKGETGIFSWDISDISYTQRKTLFNSKDLRNAADAAQGVSGEIKWFDCLSESKDGGDGYIYSILGYDDDANSLDGRLIRYSTDGKKIEFIGSEKLASVTVYDNAVYYSSADENKKGLYRMNTDGTDAQPVAGTEKLGGIRELNYIDGKLYFIAEADDKTGAVLYSKEIDGNGCTRLSDSVCVTYYVSTGDATLYYFGGENEAPTVYSKPLAGGEERSLFETRLCKEAIDPATECMTADGEYIYFSSTGFKLPVFINAEDAEKDKTGLIYHKTVSGMRYDLTAGAMDYIYCHYTGTVDETTGEKLTAGPVLIEYSSDKGSLKDSVSGLYIY